MLKGIESEKPIEGRDTDIKFNSGRLEPLGETTALDFLEGREAKYFMVDTLHLMSPFQYFLVRNFMKERLQFFQADIYNQFEFYGLHV